MASTDPSAPFMLSAELAGHEGPVRAVCALADGRLVSGAQDATARVWAPKRVAGSGELYYEPTLTIAEHNHWVVATAAVPDGAADGLAGGFVTGCMDKLIRVFDAHGNLARKLEGHDGGVISFSWTAGAQLISGSWDGTARVWDLASGGCLATLQGHENGVCVLGLPNGSIATGSTGKQSGNGVIGFQIRLWGPDGRQAKSLTEHTSAVRCLDVVPGVGFMSTSNDGTARLWSLEGEAVACMPHAPTREGQPAFVLAGCSLPGGLEYATGDEGGGCVVWRGAEQLQTLMHPNSIWCVSALANSDFATACQDSVVRVFTRSSERVAPAATIASFEKAVQEAAAAAARGPSDVEIQKLPAWENRFAARGRSEGQVQMFQREGKAIAAQWSSASSVWIEIGEVMGSSNAGAIDGVQYDHVFPIELESHTGEVKKLEIGYNNGQNPFVAAQTFMDSHQLPQHYLAQIADYITQRAGHQTPTIGADSTAPANRSGLTGFSGVGDPTGFATGGGSSGAGYGGGSGGSGGSSSGNPFAGVGSYLVLDTGANLPKIREKIVEFNGQVSEEGLRLSAQELAALETLSNTLAATNRYHASEVSRKEAAVACKVASWPVKLVFPCLDLCRILVLHPHAANVLASAQDLGPALVTAAAARCAEAMGTDVQMQVSLCSARLFANALRAKPPRGIILPRLATVMDAVSDLATSDKKPVRLALATLLFNVAVALRDDAASLRANEAAEAAQQLVAIAFEVLTAANTASPPLEDESLLRVLRAVGIAVSAGTVTPAAAAIGQAAAGAARDIGLAAAAAAAAAGRPAPVQTCLQQLRSVLPA